MSSRSRSRVSFHVKASIEHNGKVISGDVENLSTGGMFVMSNESFPVDADVDITVYLTGSTSELSLKINGTVVRRAEGGFALNFREIELDSFMHLRNIIEFNSEGEADVLKEIENHL